MSFIKTGVYQTYLDFNFAAQSTQNVNSDGAFTLGGMTWTKGNSTNEATHLSITNGSGAVFLPTSTSSYEGTTRTLPYMWLPFNQIGGLPTLNWHSKIRVWANISADNCTASGDNSVLAIDNNSPGSLFFYTMLRGYNTTQNASGYQTGSGASPGTPTISSGLTLGTGNRVMMLDIDICRTSMSILVGSNATVWPDPSAMNLMCVSTIAGTNLATSGVINPFSTMGVLLGAQRNSSSTSLSITIANLRVDIAQFE